MDNQKLIKRFFSGMKFGRSWGAIRMLKKTPCFNKIRVANIACNNPSKSDKNNLSAVLYGVNDLKLEDRPIPVPKDIQALLLMEVVGICGSDVHYWATGKCGPFVVKKPMVIGHEASGTVIKVGKKVKNLKPGDRVAIEPGIPCRMCPFCKEGNYHLCPDMAFCATPPVDGNLSRFYVHDADFLFKLPSHVSLEEGAILEPLSVGVHSCKRGRVKFGSTVFISGAGPIGLVTLLVAKAFGAMKVVISDIVESRLKVAQKLGADGVVLLIRDESDASILGRITKVLGDLATVTFDCSGAEQSVRIAIQATKTGGTSVLVGLGGKDDLLLPMEGLLTREVDVRGSFRYANDYQDSLDLVATGKINLKPLVTHHFTMEETLKAFETAKIGAEDAIKVLIHANPDWKYK